MAQSERKTENTTRPICPHCYSAIEGTLWLYGAFNIEHLTCDKCGEECYYTHSLPSGYTTRKLTEQEGG